MTDFIEHPAGREAGAVESIGLVLGAGGVVGGAYHAGALAALAEAADWDARRAEVIVGTSAGSITGAALRAGLSGADQFARATSGELSPEGVRIVGGLAPITDIPTRPPFPRGLPLPASPQLAATALLPPWRRASDRGAGRAPACRQCSHGADRGSHSNDVRRPPGPTARCGSARSGCATANESCSAATRSM